MHERGLDETDLAILESLVIQPRSSWSLVGSVLGISPSTAARRWEALYEAGIAWMSCTPGTFRNYGDHVLEIQVKCQPNQIREVADQLITHPNLVSVLLVSGDWDIELTAYSVGRGGLRELLEDPVWTAPGIIDIQVSIGTHTFSEGTDWKVGALTLTQQKTLALKSGRGPVPGAAELTELQKIILRHLQVNPRVKSLHIAEQARVSVATVSRQIDQFIKSGLIKIRTEISSSVDDWPVAVYLYIQCPAVELENLGYFVARMNNTRLSMSVINSRWNFVSAHWLRNYSQIHQTELEIQRHFPQAHVVSRSVRLRELKRVGWILDQQQHPREHIIPPLF